MPATISARDTQIPVTLSGFAGCGRRAKGRSKRPSRIQICRLGSEHGFCLCRAAQRNAEIRALITLITALPYILLSPSQERGGRIFSYFSISLN